MLESSLPDTGTYGLYRERGIQYTGGSYFFYHMVSYN